MSERWTKEHIWGAKRKNNRKRVGYFSEELILEVKRKKDIPEKENNQRQMQGLMKKIIQQLQVMGTGEGNRGRNFLRKVISDMRLVELLKIMFPHL